MNMNRRVRSHNVGHSAERHHVMDIDVIICTKDPPILSNGMQCCLDMRTSEQAVNARGVFTMSRNSFYQEHEAVAYLLAAC